MIVKICVVFISRDRFNPRWLSFSEMRIKQVVRFWSLFVQGLVYRKRSKCL